MPKATKTRGWRRGRRGEDDARQRILIPLKFARVELGDAVENEVTVVQPRTHDGAGDVVGEILVDQKTDVAK